MAEAAHLIRVGVGGESVKINTTRKMEEPGVKEVGPTLLTAFPPCSARQTTCQLLIGKSVSPSRMGSSAQLFVVLINSRIK